MLTMMRSPTAHFADQVRLGGKHECGERCVFNIHKQYKGKKKSNQNIILRCETFGVRNLEQQGDEVRRRTPLKISSLLDCKRQKTLSPTTVKELEDLNEAEGMSELQRRRLDAYFSLLEQQPGHNEKVTQWLAVANTMGQEEADTHQEDANLLDAIMTLSSVKCKTKREGVVMTAIEDDTPKVTAPMITLTINLGTLSVQRLRVVLIPK
jgi:hypothetical protein